MKRMLRNVETSMPPATAVLPKPQPAAPSLASVDPQDLASLGAHDKALPPPPPVERTGEPITDPLGDFLSSRQGKALQREVVRGMFGLLRKRL